MSRKDEIIVGLDIGTTKICAVVGMISDGNVEILGTGSHPSEGLRKGVVVNIETTVESIKKAVAEAELMSSCEITSVITGIAGGHIKGFSSHGVIAIRGREVTQKDKERVVDAARAVAIPTDREVIHILPQEFILDGQSGIQDRVGMSGVRLESKVHMVTGAVASAHNLIKCCNMAGLDVADIVLQSLASAEAVLTPEEMGLGRGADRLWRRHHRPGHVQQRLHQAHRRAGPGRHQPDHRPGRGPAHADGRRRKSENLFRLRPG